MSVLISGIIISKVRPNLKKFVFIDENNKNYYYTSAFIHLRPKKLNKILYYSLRSIFYNNLIAISRQGKGYPTIKEDDMLCLKFDKNIIDSILKKQNHILNYIFEIESKIKELKNNIKTPQDIINNIFIEKFNLNYNHFLELKKSKYYNLNFYCFANNKDLRQSVKFHKDAGKFVIKQLKAITNKKIKDFIAEPIILGSSISPRDYNNEEDYYYISMASIKNWEYSIENSKQVLEDYYMKNNSKTVFKNDILFARSGEGTIGKVALIADSDLKAIFCDFIMRIRLKNYNPLFAYYYFRTDYFQYLVHTHKKGLGNNTNIFPSQIQEFPMIDIPIKEQEKIANLINKELKIQEQIKNQIEENYIKIENLLTNIIKSSEDE